MDLEAELEAKLEVNRSWKQSQKAVESVPESVVYEHRLLINKQLETSNHNQQKHQAVQAMENPVCQNRLQSLLPQKHQHHHRELPRNSPKQQVKYTD